MTGSKVPQLLVLGAGLALASVPLGPTLAASCDDVTFPDSVSVDGTDLVLNGLGIRKATFLNVHVYVAGLYLPEQRNDPGQILATDQDWQLALRFVRDVGADDMKEAFEEGFEKAGADVTSLQPRIDAFTATMVDFEEGQTVAFSHAAADGVEVAVDGTARGTVEGADFADALLAIWLGPEPPNDDLKTGLLGGACE